MRCRVIIRSSLKRLPFIRLPRLCDGLYFKSRAFRDAGHEPCEIGMINDLTWLLELPATAAVATQERNAVKFALEAAVGRLMKIPGPSITKSARKDVNHRIPEPVGEK
jgi:hypothetical protein